MFTRLPLLTIFLILTHLSFGQEAWQHTYQQAQQHYQQGNLRQGYQLAKQALVRARLEQAENPTAYAENLRLLSLICYSSAKMHEGIQYAQHELKIRQKMGQEQQPVFGEALHNIGLLQMGIEQYDSAILHLQKAASKITDHNRLLQVLYQTGRAYQAADDLVGADAAFTAATQLMQKDSANNKLLFQTRYQQALLKADRGPEDAYNAFYELKQSLESAHDTLSRVYINTLCQLATQQKTLSSPSEVMSLYEKARKLLVAVRPIDSLQYAYVVDNLGMLHLSQGDLQQAEYFISRAYLIRSQYLNRQQNMHWVSVDHMAQVLQEKKGNQAAIQYYESNLEGTSTQMPFQYAVVLNNLALLYGKQGEHAKAAAYYHLAIATLQATTENAEQVKPLMASVYYNVARNFQHQHHFDSAIYYYKHAVAWSKEYAGKTSAEYRAGINSIAGLYHDIGYFTEAEIFYQETLQIEQAVNGEESNAYANVLNNYALLLQAKGDYQQAEEMLNQVIAIKKKDPMTEVSEILPALSNLGLLYLNTANYQKARPLLQEALTGYQRLLSGQQVETSAHGTAAMQQPAFAEERAAGLITHLVNMAKLELAEAHYTKAEPLLKRARSIAETAYGREDVNFAEIQVEMANLYLSLGNYEAAEVLLRESRRVFEQKYGKIHPDYAAATQNLATLYESTNRDTLAEAFFTEALQIDMKVLGKSHPDYAVAVNNLASFYQNNGYNEKALPLLEEALTISRHVYGKEHPFYTTTLLNLCLLYQDDEQYRKAESLIEEALVIRRKVLGELHPEYAYALYSKAVLYHQMKRYQEAIPIFHEVVGSYLRQIKAYFPALSEKEKSAFYKRIEPVLNAYRDFVVDVFVNKKYKDEDTGYGMLGELYNVQLTTKAMLLHTSGKIRENILNSGDAQLLQTYEAWSRQKKKLAQAYTTPRNVLQEKGIDISAIEAKANELEKQLSAGSALFAQDIGFSNITWQDVQQHLQEHEAAIEIIRGQEKQTDRVFYVALTVTSFQKHPVLSMLPQGQEMEGKNYFYYKNAISFRVRDTLSYELYWKNIQQQLPQKIQTVYVAPDGIYNKVSLNSLFDPASGKFLLQQLTIRMLSSTRGLAENPGSVEKSQAKPQAYLFGYPNYRLEIAAQDTSSGTLQDRLPELLATKNIEAGAFPFGAGIKRLPGTQREINAIDTMLQAFDWETYKFTDNIALEENIKQIRNPNLLHIATHGYFMSDLIAGNRDQFYGIHLKSMAANPLLRSGLLMAGSEQTMLAASTDENIIQREGEDGILTAYEAMNMDLKDTELVILSACETGLGDVRNGEGVYGLQRAFLVAGAESVLMSLWKVNDQVTTQMIKSFYHHWLRGIDKSEAMRKAQAAIKDIYKDPYYWGAFVLMEN